MDDKFLHFMTLANLYLKAATVECSDEKSLAYIEEAKININEAVNKYKGEC